MSGGHTEGNPVNSFEEEETRKRKNRILHEIAGQPSAECRHSMEITTLYCGFRIKLHLSVTSITNGMMWKCTGDVIRCDCPAGGWRQGERTVS